MPAARTTRSAFDSRAARDAAPRAVSSAVEHFVDIEGVTSSNLVVPTMNSLFRFTGAPATKGAGPRRRIRRQAMKVKNSLRSLKQRHRDCRVERFAGPHQRVVDHVPRAAVANVVDADADEPVGPLMLGRLAGYLAGQPAQSRKGYLPYSYDGGRGKGWVT